MISALVVICCCYISGATGKFVPENTTKIPNNNAAYLQEKELSKDIKNYINQNISTFNSENILDITNYGNGNSLESLNNKINESELYENAHAIKENNERSFVLINQKFKSQWFDAKRPGSQKNLFDSDNRKHFELQSRGASYSKKNKENGPKGHTSQDRKTGQNAYRYKPMSAYYESYNQAPIKKASGKEYLELLKKPLIRPAPNKMDNSLRTVNANQDLFRIDNDDRKNEIAFFDDDQDSGMPNLAMQNDQESGGDCNYKGPQMLQYSTLKPKSIMDNFIPTGSESDAKLNQYLSDALRQQLIDNEVIKKHYNCYNASCDGKQNKHQNSMYNGVMQGVRCLCNQASSAGRPIQQEAPTPVRPMRQGISAQGRLMRNEGRAQSRHIRKEGPSHGRLMLPEAPSQGMLILQENALQGRRMHQHPRLPGRLMRQDNVAMSTQTSTENFDLDNVIRETEKLCQLSDTITK